MNRRFLFKSGLIALLAVLLIIPMEMVRGVVQERNAYRFQARDSIAHSWTGSQQLLGPVLVVPYLLHRERKVWDQERQTHVMEKYSEGHRLYILPERLEVKAEVRAEERHRGLYFIPVYDSRIRLAGSFDSRPLVELAVRNDIEWQKPFVSVVVTDIRGVVTQPVLEWQEGRREFLSGSELPQLAGGMHALLEPLDPRQARRYDFGFSMQLHGMETIQFSPVGKSTTVSLKANWPHPSFLGRYLPTERSVEGDGFSALWQVSSFSSDMSSAIEALQGGNSGPFSQNTFGVALMNPVDIYSLTDRAIKYGLLFVMLTFVAFFLFEVLKGLRLHAMHYLLVGTSLTVFFLLLIALSEHMAFAFAYLAAALACVGLIGFYVSAVLGSLRRALLVIGELALLYGMLFGILHSEDNALLMGSVLLFAVLSVVMVVTRSVDWYAISEQMGRQPKGGGA